MCLKLYLQKNFKECNRSTYRQEKLESVKSTGSTLCKDVSKPRTRFSLYMILSIQSSTKCSNMGHISSCTTFSRLCYLLQWDGKQRERERERIRYYDFFSLTNMTIWTKNWSVKQRNPWILFLNVYLFSENTVNLIILLIKGYQDTYILLYASLMWH